MTVMSFSLVHLAGPAARRPRKNTARVNTIRFRATNVHYSELCSRSNAVNPAPGGRHDKSAAGNKRRPGHTPALVHPPDGDQNRRRALTRERVVAEALVVISTGGVGALSMRALATRLGVVPGALYRHVSSKEQLHDLILDSVLAEVDRQADPSLTWTGQVSALAHRLRAVLEHHPGIAALLKTRDPLSPHSLALVEAFLTPLHAAGLPARQAALAFRLHAFLRSLPPGRFPALAALGEHVWADNRDERFTAGLGTLISGLQAARRPHRKPGR